MKTAVITVMALVLLRSLAFVLGDLVPGHPWIAGVERLLSGLATFAIMAGLACWACAGSDADRWALASWMAIMVVILVRPDDVGLPARWESMIDLARLILIIPLSFLGLLNSARVMATSTQRDVDARMGIRRITPR